MSHRTPYCVLQLTVHSTVRRAERSLDVVVADPQRSSAITKGSDSFSLIAAKESDRTKHDLFQRMIRSVGYGVIRTEKVPLSFESSGAFGPNMRDLWEELKDIHKQSSSGNFVREGLPHTWTAFTYVSFWPQQLSFLINRFTAEMVLQGLSVARQSVLPG